ncbi:MAG: DUF503 family protein [Armatimonadetes bacterium]|nr:DUF503 family protein [Armatimonadota bacterium]NIM23749.1 DUF503 family protein [Armatimonadota bacterium]NIM67626.1 DUF503 family protein [Armatimonadota bacterium]NIM76145.1 DUF503 family protein [Armatimonadota bacterium]NIN06828.1 DUF503 family protein [Armatimonadota bacterium]
MHIGTQTFMLEITDGLTLKDKRQVVRSLLDRARSRFHVAAAEIDHLDSPRWATIAIVTVSNDLAVANRTLEKVAQMVESEPRALIVERNVVFL